MVKINGIETYFGGKAGAGTYQQIINEIRPHQLLIVPFLGNCGVTRNITRADNTIGIDISSFIVEKWKSMGFDWIDLINGNALEILNEKLYSRDTVIYADPPYPISSRKDPAKVYEHEMTDKDHVKLLKVLKRQECDVLISTYENDIYKKNLKGWRVKKYNSMTRRGLAKEWLYMNYDKPIELHDYSFLGDNFRERERIKKKIYRHTKKFFSLPVLERNAILKNLGSSIVKNEDMPRVPEVVSSKIQSGARDIFFDRSSQKTMVLQHSQK